MGLRLDGRRERRRIRGCHKVTERAGGKGEEVKERNIISQISGKSL